MTEKTTTIPKRLPGGPSLYHIIQYLNQKYSIKLDVAFAIPEGDRSIYFQDLESGSVAIFACFDGPKPCLQFFCMKTQVLLPMDMMKINVELHAKFYPPKEVVVSPENPLPGLWFRK